MNVACKHINEKAMRDAMLAQIINHIAEKNGCRATIDFDHYTINIDGPDAAKLAIAEDLDNWFG
jgi:hypothetical protein